MSVLSICAGHHIGEASYCVHASTFWEYFKVEQPSLLGAFQGGAAQFVHMAMV